MILRRLAQNLREQNWTAIAIEFVLLVLGVFLGIQAANWNAEMSERREARGALQRLADDLRLSIQLTQSTAEFMTAGARDADRVLDHLRACALPDADRDRFASGMYRLGKIMSARLVRTTFEELRDSGKLRLVGDVELRRMLSETVRRQDSHEEVFKLKSVRMDPHIAYVDAQVIFAVDAGTGGGGTIGWQQLDIDFDAACGDRRFHTAVGAIRNYTYDALYDSQRMQGRFEDLLALLEKELAAP
jgi:hypothetical protein